MRTNFFDIPDIRLLWLDLNCSYAHSSLALPALHAQLPDNRTNQWEIITATINENTDMIVSKIYKKQPQVIAATNWLFTHEQLLHILSRTKALLPECHIILGGPEFLGDNEEFLRKNKYIDVVFRGEGEENFPIWLHSWNDRTQWSTITGLCYLDRQGEYHDNGLARVLDFNQLTPPESSRFFNWSKPFVQLETTRGCFNTCAFCVSGGEKPVRNLTIDTIRKRLQVIHDKGIRNIRVLDRTFNYNLKHAKALINLFLEFSDLRYHLEIHPALLSDELKKLLPTLPKGLLHLEAGIQSLHEQVLNVSRRIGKLQDALDGLKFLCSLPNMETHTDLIAGLPFYKLEDIWKDVHVLAEYDADEIQLESLKLLPGTEMRRRASELGIVYSPYPPYEVLRTNEISIHELQTANRLSRLLDNFYNTPAWHGITRHLMLAYPDFLPAFLAFLTERDIIDNPLSLEKRGMLLYDFCKMRYPASVTTVSMAWIEAGMSLKKIPAEHVRTKCQRPPQKWEIEYGTYKNELRLCFLPSNEKNVHEGYWFGFDSETQQSKPIFKAFSHL